MRVDDWRGKRVMRFNSFGRNGLGRLGNCQGFNYRTQLISDYGCSLFALMAKILVELLSV